MPYEMTNAMFAENICGCKNHNWNKSLIYKKFIQFNRNFQLKPYL